MVILRLLSYFAFFAFGFSMGFIFGYDTKHDNQAIEKATNVMHDKMEKVKSRMR